MHVRLLSVLLLPFPRHASFSSSHYHCCCCCCCCSCVLMVLLGCRQAWCVTLSAPPAHLLAAELLYPALHAQALVLFTLAFLLNSVSTWPSSNSSSPWPSSSIHLHPGVPPQFNFTLPSSSIHLHPGLPPQFIFTLAFLLNLVSPWPSSNSSLPCHAAEPLLCPHNQL